MTKPTLRIVFFLIATLIGISSAVADPTLSIPMHTKQTGTYYLAVSVNGTDHNDMMLDTGSEFMVINETTLKSLQHDAQVTHGYDISGVLADGSNIKVPVYHLSSLRIGCCCVVRDVDAAVFPGKTREILGLTALRKVAPFSISLEPAKLTLSNCSGTTAERQSAAIPGISSVNPEPVNFADIASMTQE